MNPTTLLTAPLTDEGNYLAFLVALLTLSGAGYCLYKSAKSLAPLNRMTMLDSRPLQELDTGKGPDFNL